MATATGGNTRKYLDLQKTQPAILIVAKPAKINDARQGHGLLWENHQKGPIWRLKPGSIKEKTQANEALQASFGTQSPHQRFDKPTGTQYNPL